MAPSDPFFTPEALRNLAKDNGPEYVGRSRRALRWCADVIEATDAVVQESAEVRKADEALIRNMLSAMDNAQTEAQWGNAYGRCDTSKFDVHIAAARARLTPCPGQRQPE